MTTKIKAGSKVAKYAGNRGEYWRGSVTKINGNKALVYFESRNLSRWCSISNLEQVI